MSLILFLIFIGLLLIALFPSAINSHVAEKKSKTIKQAIILGVTKALSDIAIGLIMAAIPTVIFLNYLKPQPQGVMPVFFYDGTYMAIADNKDYTLAQSLIDDCTVYIEKSKDVTKYFGRAFFYFKTNNYDLVRDDLQKCVELEERSIY